VIVGSLTAMGTSLTSFFESVANGFN